MEGGSNTYRVRAEALKVLGFDSYADYLASPGWAAIKKLVMERSNGHCEVCGKRAYTAHHVTYSVPVLTGRDLSQLVAVCRGCHNRTEFEDGKKLLTARGVYESFCKIAGKKKRRKHKPVCRCCRKAIKQLGREGICLACYRKHGPKVHQIAADKDRESMT